MASVKFETVNCNLCGQDNYQVIANSYDRLHPNHEVELPEDIKEFQMVRCRNCSLIYQNPRPTQASIGTFYPEQDYYSFKSQKSFFLTSLEKAIHNHYGHQKSQQETTWAQRTLGYLIKGRVGIPKYEKDKSILDIGSGDGFVIKVLKKIGWTVYGTEVSQRAVDEAKREGVQVFLGQIEDINFGDLKFDYIRMSHSLEHLPNPKKSLKKILYLLKPGGKLIILVPNYASPSAIFFKNRWLGLDLPRHLYVFTPKTLTKLLEESGFEVEKIKEFGSKGMLAGFTYTFNDLNRRLTGKNINVQRLLTNQILSGIDLLLNYSASLVNVGDNMEVWSSKK